MVLIELVRPAVFRVLEGLTQVTMDYLAKLELPYQLGYLGSFEQGVVMGVCNYAGLALREPL